MRTTTNKQGIDYGMGLANVDKTTGIRYGIINHHSLGADFLDEFEADYGSPMCPKCYEQADSPEAFGESFAAMGNPYARDGAELPEGYTDEDRESREYVCVECKHFFGSESAFGDEAIGFYIINDAGLLAHYDGSGFGVWIEQSPYYTYAHFCSPCAPGACDLDSPLDVGDVGFGLLAHAAELDKTYCFGHECFEDGKAPYRVFRVVDGTEVLPGE